MTILFLIIWISIGFLLTILHKKLSKEKIHLFSIFGLSLLGPCMLPVIITSFICDLY
jgi:hypothetical protein